MPIPYINGAVNAIEIGSFVVSDKNGSRWQIIEGSYYSENLGRGIYLLKKLPDGAQLEVVNLDLMSNYSYD